MNFKILSAFISVVFTIVWAKDNCLSQKSNSKLFCYYSKLTDVEGCGCSHVILPSDTDVKSIERFRDVMKGVKVLINVNEFNQGLVDLLKTSKVDGLEISLRKLDSKNDISDFISTVRTKLGSDLQIVLSVPPKNEILAKYFDFKTLSKNTDHFILQTSFLGANKNTTFHPSRLSGLWDMQNTDSVVDLVTGLGAPLSKLVITLPVQGFHFKLQNSKFTTPGSPALEVKSITRDELCGLMKNGKNWTLERDEDQAGPYIFSENDWVAFEDATSVNIKAKYSRIRGLAGIALKDVSQDGGSKCESTILEAAYNGLSKQARAPRGAVLHSLEREIIESPARSLDNIQISPYRISRVVDVEGHVHIVKKDTRTEFECSRQGYFVHPRSCNRFYRCVKFDQYSDEFSVFEFDCPAGLAFDEHVEVCVWPGSLPHASACSGSSEIAPVPKNRFVCPEQPGYYADLENCRWFFACLDHGNSPLTAYEFRCPFGLVFDQDRLICEWPWFVPKCANGEGFSRNIVTQDFYGSGYVLDQYDGLSSLGPVKLGGLSGTITQPVAKVYSNVEGSTLELGLSKNARLSLVNAGLLKTVSAGFALNSFPKDSFGQFNSKSYGNGAEVAGVGSDKYYSSGSQISGFSNEGFAELNGVVGSSSGQYYYQNGGKLIGEAGIGNEGSVGLKLADRGGSSSQYFNQRAGVAGGDDQSSAQLIGKLVGVTLGNSYQGAAENSAQYYNQEHGNNFAESYLGTARVNVSTEIIDYNAGNNVPTMIDSGEHYSSDFINGLQGSAGLSNQYRNHQQQENNQYYSAGSQIVYGQQEGNLAELENSAKYGAKSHQTFLQYQEKTTNEARYLNEMGLGTFGSGTIGNINIVGGGYSAVGVSDGVQISNNGGNINLVSVTPSPIPISTDPSIPIVSSVPIPTIKSDTTFQSKGGVVANVPQLQYKVRTTATPSSQYIIKEKLNPTLILQSAKLQPKPISIIQSAQQQLGGYVYEKPTITFGEKTVGQLAVSPVNFQKQDSSGGYIYEKPLVAFEEKPEVYIFSTPRTVVKQKVISSTPKPFAVSGGYIYEKPLVAFEEKPEVYISSTPRTVVKQKVISSTPKPFAVSGGYIYEKPLVAFEEKPEVYISSTPRTVFKQKVISYTPKPFAVSSTVKPIANQQPVLTFSTPRPFTLSTNYDYRNIAQTVSYSYPKSVLPFVEKTDVKIEPTVQTYQSIFDQKNVEQKQSAIFYNYKQQEQKLEPVVQTYKVKQQGYIYEKPSVEFEEKPTATYQQIDLSVDKVKPIVVQPVQSVQPAVVQTFHHQQPTVQKAVIEKLGIQYEKPDIVFQERPKSTVISSFHIQQPTAQTVQAQENVQTVDIKEGPTIAQTLHIEQPTVETVKSVSYGYAKPAIKFGDKHLSLQTAHIQQPAETLGYYKYPATQKTVYQNIVPLVQQQPDVFTTYSYQKPAVTKYTYKDVVQQTYIAPTSTTLRPVVAYVSSTVIPVVDGYHYPKPSTTFVEEPRPIVTEAKKPVFSTYNYVHPTTSKPLVEEQSVVTEFKKPTVVTQYSYVARQPKPVAIQPIVNEYKKPVIVSHYSFVAPQPKPITVPSVQPVEYKKPAIVTQYNYETPQVQSVVAQPVPSVAIEREKPADISSYNYVYPSTPKPQVLEEQSVEAVNYVTTSTQKPFVYENKIEFRGYEYPKPEDQLETIQPVQEVPFVKKKVYVTGSRKFQGYTYEKPRIKFEEQPIVVENYAVPKIKQFSSSVDTSNFYFINRAKGIRYSTTPVYQEEYIQSTPRPTFSSTINAIVAAKLPAVTPKPVILYGSSEQAVETVTTSRPIVRYSFSSLDEMYQPNNKLEYLPVKTKVRVSTIPKYGETYIPEVSSPTIDYLPVSTTPNYVKVPEVTSSKINYVPGKTNVRVSTTPKYVEVVPDFTREYLPVKTRIGVTTPKYVEITSTEATILAPTKEYLPIEPTKEYLPVTTTRPKTVVVPTKEYLPVTTKVPNRQYLPVRSRVRVSTTTTENYDDGETIEVTSRRPVKVVKVIRPKVKTIIKQNDMHPLLSAKLGAQCTCVSNTLRLRKKKPQKIIIVEEEDDDSNDDDDDDQNTDEYLVKDDADDNEDNSAGIIVEDYKYEPKKLVTSTPEVNVSSTSATVVSSSPEYKVRKRVRVRPVSTTQASEVFIKSTLTPVVKIIKTVESKSNESSEKEIVKGIRTGLKLVKQAAKEGVKEGIEETISKNFDRYGPGGLRSRSETLQGTIDCQRAGLFRHPTQCNKFYTCRWDCTKKKFTLHVFNCPVHLTFDSSLGACNWPSQGPACLENTLLPSE